MPHVFVYGSLLSSKIVQQLTGRVFETVPAILHGFNRHRINGCDYPAIIPNRYAKVGGLLLINVDELSLNVLTFFEGNEYQAEMVNVETENGKLNATAFIWKGNTKLLSETDWDWNEFERDSLEIYCEKIIPETILEYSQIKG